VFNLIISLFSDDNNFEQAHTSKSV